MTLAPSASGAPDKNDDAPATASVTEFAKEVGNAVAPRAADRVQRASRGQLVDHSDVHERQRSRRRAAGKTVASDAKLAPTDEDGAAFGDRDGAKGKGGVLERRVFDEKCEQNPFPRDLADPGRRWELAPRDNFPAGAKGAVCHGNGDDRGAVRRAVRAHGPVEGDDGCKIEDQLVTRDVRQRRKSDADDVGSRCVINDDAAVRRRRVSQLERHRRRRDGAEHGEECHKPHQLSAEETKNAAALGANETLEPSGNRNERGATKFRDDN